LNGRAAVPDDDLIPRHPWGDQEAFRELVERYKGRAFGVAVGIVRDGDDAMDVVPGVVREGRTTNLKEFRFGANFYTWFYRLLVNQAIDRWRKSSRSAECGSTRAGCPDASPPDSLRTEDPEDLASSRELGEALQRPSAGPPGVHRGGVMLRSGGGGMPYGEEKNRRGRCLGSRWEDR